MANPIRQLLTDDAIQVSIIGMGRNLKFVTKTMYEGGNGGSICGCRCSMRIEMMLRSLESREPTRLSICSVSGTIKKYSNPQFCIGELEEPMASIRSSSNNNSDSDL